tara:strand:- start:110 stop:304 length:195 start_codon:yes stop_codon:yes gene_type:complete
MAIDPSSIKKGRKSGRYFPKWAIYSSAGIGVLILVGLIKTLLPLIGMAFLFALIWSQATNNRNY